MGNFQLLRVFKAFVNLLKYFVCSGYGRGAAGYNPYSGYGYGYGAAQQQQQQQTQQYAYGGCTR